MSYCTTDLMKFGKHELQLAAELLTAYTKQGVPPDFNDDGTYMMLNTESGFVFLTNGDYQVAMMNGEKLETFYTDHETGEEGFWEDLTEESKKRLWETGCHAWDKPYDTE